jgi:hypothetical protein
MQEGRKNGQKKWGIKIIDTYHFSLLAVYRLIL